ncbi:MAG TPA: ABC transporter transmembrane domain-containing protein [Nitrosomonas sp.]|nr:ABC transporter transmembrane domain-containing protein [Nitrosomonas sp.]HQX13559.1 ABC transporter transmembrane domain-containing protein [Nitrosomonas sp.]HRB32945.1 ABC transporter transmembrane domain-containing protein [Nitrosomonas sp.]HRB45606.1 ABC transporter transmembrane domain-containing protein [Nitrosomonas sp.]HRB77611.1 ABC transporter transmembrane domain-containing protein [Nitrosomonas sp.]
MHFYPIYRRLIKKLATQWKLSLLLLFIFFIGAIVIALFPIAIKQLLDSIFIEEDWVLVQKSFVMILMLGITQAIVNFSGNHLTQMISRGFGINFPQEVLSKLLTLSIDQYEDFIKQKKLNELFQNIIQINLVTIEKLILLIKESFLIVGLSICIIYLHKDFLLLALLLTLSIIFIKQIAADQFNKINQEYRKSFNNVMHSSIQSIQHYKEIKLNQGQAYESYRFGKTISFVFEKNQPKIVIKSVINFLTEIIVMCIIVLSIYLLTLEIMHTGFNFDETIALIAATSLLFFSIYKWKIIFATLSLDTKRLAKVFSFLDQITDEDKEAQPLSTVQGKLQFEHILLDEVSQPALTLNMTILPSEKIIFTQYSTEAKNRLIDFLLRFQKISSGRILLDNQSIEKIKIDDLHANVALISKNTVPLDDTVAGNIAYGAMRHATETQITSAVHASASAYFIKTMPEGLQTRIGKNGAQIQEAEYIKIAIARTLLKNPKILILDEVSNLKEFGNPNEGVLKNLTQNRTTLIFSNNVSSEVNCDLIVNLENGNVMRGSVKNAIH